jgi:hypothetical protein
MAGPDPAKAMRVSAANNGQVGLDEDLIRGAGRNGKA